MSTSSSSDGGFTGLEAAIVLIAFVIVAAVFAFVALQAGFRLHSRASRSSTRHRAGGSSCTVNGIVYGISAAPTI
jgi:flagellin FlaB